GYGEFKSDVAEAVVEHIRPIRKKYDELSEDKQYLVDIYTKGAERANQIANRTLNKVYKKIGFII
ncbi:MAG: tryptophan--tRNA ligase, partial [Clostridia bacterium]|nr:tryptophan--tRNA ligase [Clostridia bacterium]